MTRDSELMRNPRPLAGPEREVLDAALAPVLADLAAAGLAPDIRYEAHHERPSQVCARVQGPGITGTGIEMLLLSSRAKRVWHLAEQFWHWAADVTHDAGQPPWPRCPDHYRSGQHALSPGLRDGVAVWTCWPGGDRVICPIGQLAEHYPRSASRNNNNNQ